MTEKVQVVSNADALFDVSASSANKAAADLQRRLNDERALTELLTKICAVRERLYALRWAEGAEYVTKKRDVAVRRAVRLRGGGKGEALTGRAEPDQGAAAPGGRVHARAH
jgi:hypothetical protein